MKNTFKFAFAVSLFALTGAAQASSIEVQTAYSAAGSQGSASAYQSVVEAAIASQAAHPIAGYGTADNVASYNNISNQSLFNGSQANIAMESTINFGVSAANAGTWDIRTGVDFGKGGAIFVDGTAMAVNSSDMWWNNNYGNNGSFNIVLNLSAGNHTVSIYGLEDCCSGYQQAQFSNNTTSFTTFSTSDHLTSAVPEPESYGMMMGGLGLLGCMIRRRKSA